eukprot:9248051-Ditylum_brightwellii.AAC.1
MPEAFISAPTVKEVIIEIAIGAMKGDLINKDNLCTAGDDVIEDYEIEDDVINDIVTVGSRISGSLGTSIKDSLSHQDITCFSHEDII